MNKLQILLKSFTHLYSQSMNMFTPFSSLFLSLFLLQSQDKYSSLDSHISLVILPCTSYPYVFFLTQSVLSVNVISLPDHLGFFYKLSEPHPLLGCVQVNIDLDNDKSQSKHQTKGPRSQKLAVRERSKGQDRINFKKLS